MGTAADHLRFESRQLEAVFDGCFAQSENTRLFGGASEPLYQPATAAGEKHRLYYREDYFASALHEISHWCIAGPERRLLLDFGYWYAPEGRTGQQQRAFETVEVKPQALEWLFSRACGYRFRVSVDNFTDCGTLPDTTEFCGKVFVQAVHWQQTGLPVRAGQFFQALSAHFGTCVELERLVLTPAELTG